jgi:RND family efflux transporter MFP subunit
MRYNSLLFIILYCLISCKKEEKPVNQVPKSLETIVKTVVVGKNEVNTRLQTVGVVMSKNESKPSFKTGGVISKILIAEGAFVSKGQLIATLHLDEINAQVRQAEEGLLKAQRDLARAKNLFADSVATLEQFQNATSAYEFASKNLEIAKFNRQYSECRAPISGKVAKLISRQGEVVGPGMPVCAIIGTQQKDWIIKVGLVDKDWSRTKVGDKATITLDAYPGQTFSGIVSQKSQMVANSSGTFEIEINMANQPKTLAAGLIAKVNIQSDGLPQDLTVIPIEALVKSDGSTAEAYTIVDGKAKLVRLSIAAIHGDKVAINGGLDGVTELITTGALFLEEGDLVRKL